MYTAQQIFEVLDRAATVPLPDVPKHHCTSDAAEVGRAAAIFSIIAELKKIKEV